MRMRTTRTRTRTRIRRIGSKCICVLKLPLLLLFLYILDPFLYSLRPVPSSIAALKLCVFLNLASCTCCVRIYFYLHLKNLPTYNEIDHGRSFCFWMKEGRGCGLGITYMCGIEKNFEKLSMHVCIRTYVCPYRKKKFTKKEKKPSHPPPSSPSSSSSCIPNP